MGITCIIEFDNNPFGTFFAGQVMTGKVTIKLDKVKQLQAVAINISGYAETHWTESSGTGDNKSTDTYCGREDYIASQTYVVGSNLSSQMTLQPGVHVYTFACQIPLTCPSSIESHYGKVRYMTKVSLIRPWKFDQSYLRCFTVLKTMDLNYENPLIRMAPQVESQKNYCCWPCGSGPMQMQLSLPQSGFVAGQIIPVHLVVTNDSHIKVEELEIKLVMIVTCYATHLGTIKTQTQRFVVTKMTADPVPVHCKKDFNYELRVPATPPTCYTLCKIIQITYQLEVEARVKGCHRNGVITVPLTIGTVPLAVQNQMKPRDLQTLDVVDLNHALPAASAPASDFNCPPPNYEAAVHMHSADGSNVAKFGSADYPNTLSLDGNGFTPMYPVFDLPSPTAPPEATQDFTDGTSAVNAETNAKKGTWL